MKFSIVITTYNRLTWLKRAIDSALDQTLPCETIVVDDSSSDGTEAYIKARCEELISTGDKRLIYHRNETKLGHAGSVNAGVAIATGEWVKLIDDDDYIEPNCIEEIAIAIANHPETVISSIQAIQVDANGVELQRTRKVGISEILYIPQPDIHYNMLLELLPFGTPIQVAFSRDAFIKSGGWDSSLDTNFDDIDSWLRIADFGDAVFINKYLAYRTRWTGAYNHMFSIEKRLKTNLLIKEKIYKRVNENHRNKIPSLLDIQSYIKLHWAAIALKKGQLIAGLKIAITAKLSLTALQLFWQNSLRRG